jgi:transposase
MLSFEGKQVYLAAGPTDMRKQINGLSTLVEACFKLRSTDPCVFVFCNKKRNRLKILEWDKDGFWLYFKRLEKGHYSWPKAEKESYETLTLSAAELSVLISATAVTRIIKRDKIGQLEVI